MATSLLFGGAVLWASPVDAASPSQIASSPIVTPSGPIFSVVSPDGSTIFVTTAGANEVTRIDAATGAVLSPFPLFSFQSQMFVPGAGMAVSPDGQRLYVVIPSTDEVVVLDAVNGNPLTSYGTGSGIFPSDNPLGIALSLDGTRAFVTKRGTNTLTAFYTQSGALIDTVILSGAPGMPSVHPGEMLCLCPWLGLERRPSTSLT